MVVFRVAFAEDASALSQIAFRSESYLGYDSAYMKKYSDLYNVTEEFISQNTVYILEDKGALIGFWGLSKTDNNSELEFFYIDAPYIGKGYGSKLWNHLIGECNNLGVSEFFLVTSPQSAPFYERMGAVVIEYVESRIVFGRMIPRLKYTV